MRTLLVVPFFLLMASDAFARERASELWFYPDARGVTQSVVTGGNDDVIAVLQTLVPCTFNERGGDRYDGTCTGVFTREGLSIRGTVDVDALATAIRASGRELGRVGVVHPNHGFLTCTGVARSNVFEAESSCITTSGRLTVEFGFTSAQLWMVAGGYLLLLLAWCVGMLMVARLAMRVRWSPVRWRWTRASHVVGAGSALIWIALLAAAVCLRLNESIAAFWFELPAVEGWLGGITMALLVLPAWLVVATSGLWLWPLYAQVGDGLSWRDYARRLIRRSSTLWTLMFAAVCHYLPVPWWVGLLVAFALIFISCVLLNVLGDRVGIRTVAVTSGELHSALTTRLAELNLKLRELNVLRVEHPAGSGLVAVEGGVALTDDVIRSTPREVLLTAAVLAALANRSTGARRLGLYLLFLLGAVAMAPATVRMNLPWWLPLTFALPVVLALNSVLRRREMVKAARTVVARGYDPQVTLRALGVLAHSLSGVLDWFGSGATRIKHGDVRAAARVVRRAAGIDDTAVEQLLHEVPQGPPFALESAQEAPTAAAARKHLLLPYALGALFGVAASVLARYDVPLAWLVCAVTAYLAHRRLTLLLARRAALVPITSLLVARDNLGAPRDALVVGVAPGDSPRGFGLLSVSHVVCAWFTGDALCANSPQLRFVLRRADVVATALGPGACAGVRHLYLRYRNPDGEIAVLQLVALGTDNPSSVARRFTDWLNASDANAEIPAQLQDVGAPRLDEQDGQPLLAARIPLRVAVIDTVFALGVGGLGGLAALLFFSDASTVHAMLTAAAANALRLGGMNLHIRHVERSKHSWAVFSTSVAPMAHAARQPRADASV
ncbi:MAG: hypothetical protein AB2A00_37955 [Myxococcota bacterium]